MTTNTIRYDEMYDDVPMPTNCLICNAYTFSNESYAICAECKVDRIERGNLDGYLVGCAVKRGDVDSGSKLMAELMINTPADIRDDYENAWVAGFYSGVEVSR